MEISGQNKILVTGSGGQLGLEFRHIARSFPGFDFIFADKHELDICLHNHVIEFINELKPAAVINCAAYTNVEMAETDSHQAHLVNAKAPAFLAEACNLCDSMLIHFSTDFVFDGEKKMPYTESDDVHPLNAYGHSKWEGEKLLDEKLKRHFIIRTSWLYSTFGHNFFKTMLRLAAEKGELTVVNDQVSSPTYARHLAQDVLRLLEKAIIKTGHVEHGVYHYAQDGEASWFEFATEIILGSGLSIPVHAVSSEKFLSRAVRPAYSKLDNRKFVSNTGIASRHWKEGLADCLKHRSENGNQK